MRLWQSRIEQDLHRRYWLRMHGFGIGLLTLACTWGTTHALIVAGVGSMAVRWLIALGVGYCVYLLVLRFWAARLVRRDAEFEDPGVSDLPDLPPQGGGSASPAARSGSDDGGGAYGGFGELPESVGSAGDWAGEAIGAAAGAEEGVLVAVPVVLLFLLGCGLFFSVGSLLWLYFGFESLLAVAVELAFSIVTAGTVARVARAGWLPAVVRLTWKPLLGAVLCAGLLGAVLDALVPDARALPHAVRLLRAR
ncbi:hypothetical protein DFQ15_11444 [Xylophilus ampelinus]|uniref:Uncharacterized protein n=2 Tax=Xylophilus ampelinus TaxID=54067 RepID=A0A318SSF8_9BURK|nr:hypothetical protein DFQ15_11444 [Xylophilus ampelinus]